MVGTTISEEVGAEQCAVWEVCQRYDVEATSCVGGGELGVVWLANQTRLKPSTLRTQEIAWRTKVEPKRGDRRVGQVFHSDVQAWITALGAGGTVSATTVRRAQGVLAAILDVAVRDRRIVVTAAQVELLAQNATHGTLVWFLAYTGLRWGEATGLRISAVDTLRRRVLVRENAVSVGGTIIVGTPKTHEDRSVPYPAFLSEPLAALCEGKSRDQLVFGSGLAHMIAPKSGKGWFWSAVQRAKAVDPSFPDLTLHDLRHTAASLAISAGANPKAVQRMLGHASAAMTLDTYADLFEDDLDAVSERLSAVRAQTVVGFSWGLTASEP